MDQPIPAAVRREPWNKGKLVGQKAPLNSRTFGQSACAYNSTTGHANWRYSISASTASSVHVTS